MSAQMLKLQKYFTIKGTLVCKTGLRIGGTEAGMEIGGTDNPVIRDPNGIPYIPGSSVKGKLRTILEYKYGRVGEGGKPCGCGQPLEKCEVCTIFGPHNNTRHNLGPSRIIVRDAFMSSGSLKAWEEFNKEGKEPIEIKTETMINRQTGAAARGSLRTQERIRAGTEFDLNISLRVFDGDDEEKMLELIEEALSLLQQDYLGGSGTRGYGWVEVKDIKVSDA